jgi:endogenous inhibitor of DNA gyrase (YacG/DUF329 family)
MAKIGENSGITPISAGRRRCPICGKPAAARHQPFCSARCADIDLGRWLKDSYRVETDEGPDAEGDDDSGNS